MKKNNVNKRVTQAEIARRARVSQATVSFVLNSRFTDRVPERTRERVLKVAREIGYRTNYFARSLVLGTTNSVGLIYEDTFEFLTEDPFCSAIFRGVNQELTRRRQNLIFSTVNGMQEVLPPMMESYLVEGIILLACKNRRLPTALRERGIPHILIDPFYEEVKSPRILISNKRCAAEIVDHLAQNRHTRIGMIAPATVTGEMAWSFKERIAGFQQGLKQNGLTFDPSLLVMSTYDLTIKNEFPELRPARMAAKKMLESANRPTAIFGANDRIALGVLQQAQEMGVSVPGELAIVGFDDLQFTQTTVPPLSTVSVDKESLGRKTVEQLFNIVQGNAGPALRIQGKLVVRGSSAGAPEAVKV